MRCQCTVSLGFASVALFEFLPAPGLQARSSWPRFLSSMEHSRGHCAAASQDSSSPHAAGGPFLPQTLCTCSSPRKLFFPCLCLWPASPHPLLSANFHLLKESPLTTSYESQPPACFLPSSWLALNYMLFPVCPHPREPMGMVAVASGFPVVCSVSDTAPGTWSCSVTIC